MRGKRAKAIRKVIYGDESLKERRYNQVARLIKRTWIALFGTAKAHHAAESFTGYEGTLRAEGRRRQYQDAKREYKRRHAAG